MFDVNRSFALLAFLTGDSLKIKLDEEPFAIAIMNFQADKSFTNLSQPKEPGTLAACCKPSSGAGVVWMS